jgi:glycosyltransferase involved in cell wall biosynthesis
MQSQVRELIQTMTLNEVTLTIAYSTLTKRLGNIQYSKSGPDREIIVLVQNPDESNYNTEKLQGKLVELKSRGVAKSRNAAIQYASGKYLIFGDDDITFVEEGLQECIAYFESHPDCSIIMAQTSDENGKLRKAYPKKAHKLSRFNSAKAATYELMIRIESIRNAGIRFDENFGAGADNYLGDEYIFIADSIKKGLKGVFLPIKLAIHPSESSGSAWGTQRDLGARAKVFSRVFGPIAPFFRALFLIKSQLFKFRKGRVGILNSLRFIIGR